MVAESTELAKEQARVNQVIASIDAQIAQTKQDLADAHKETRAVEKNYGENASINRYEVDDIAESRAMIEQQRRLVNQAATTEDILKGQLATLRQLRDQPYFGRIDIQDEGDENVETLYIGTASLMNADQSSFLVYDWRAPVSAIYYNGNLGPVTYQTPAGQRTTTLVKKRQFTIVHGKITHMFDTNEVVGDKLLQQALGEHDDRQMHNIVATIQREQNTIIRNTDSDLLLVQGVAGSGKTSAILQRIAYLLYHSRESLNADQIVLFSPNLLFSHYIADVLPSLGERNMRQVTLDGFLKHRFEGLNVQTLFDTYEQQSKIPQPINDFFNQPAIMNEVVKYRDRLQNGQAALRFMPIHFRDEIFFDAEHIAAIFDTLPTTLPLADRVVRLKNALIRETQRRAREEAKSEWVAADLDTLDLQQLHALYGRHTPDDFKDEQALQKHLARRWAKKQLRVVADAIYNNYFFDINEQYADFLAQCPRPTGISTEQWQEFVSQFNTQLEYHRLSFIHTAPLMLLRDLLTGGGQNRAMQYVFIDEMQDYSLAMLIYLRHAFPAAKFTILGDAEQALFHPLQLPEELLASLKDALQAQRPRLVTLRRAYRSTSEITDFARRLLPDGDQIIPFNRHGARPRLIQTANQQEARQELINELTRMLEKPQTVAVLTATADKAAAINQQLNHAGIDAHLMTSKDSQLPSTGVAVLPIYLAKGLEFDAVIADVSQKAIAPARATGIIYTMASRAMHELTLISIGQPARVITNSTNDQLLIE